MSWFHWPVVSVWDTHSCDDAGFVGFCRFCRPSVQSSVLMTNIFRLTAINSLGFSILLLSHCYFAVGVRIAFICLHPHGGHRSTTGITSPSCWGNIFWRKVLHRSFSHCPVDLTWPELVLLNRICVCLDTHFFDSWLLWWLCLLFALNPTDNQAAASADQGSLSGLPQWRHTDCGRWSIHQRCAELLWGTHLPAGSRHTLFIKMILVVKHRGIGRLQMNPWMYVLCYRHHSGCGHVCLGDGSPSMFQSK